AAMARQRDAAREAWTGSGQAAAAGEWFGLRERLGATAFSGHEGVEAIARVQALLVDGQEAAQAAVGQVAQVLFEQTPFYAEGGGQAGDRGEAEWNGGRARVLDTQKQAGELHVHELEILEGALKPGQEVRLLVDPERRTTT